MTDFTWPKYSWNSVTMTPLHFNKKGPASAFNNVATITLATSVIWKAKMVMVPLELGPGRDFAGFLARLRGGEHLVCLYDTTRSLRGTGAGASCNVAVAAALGATSITLKNLVADQTAAFKADDAIGIAGNLYVIVADNPSDSYGNATVEINPPLRMSVAVNDVVVTANPTGRFLLESGFESEWTPAKIRMGGAMIFSEVPYT